MSKINLKVFATVFVLKSFLNSIITFSQTSLYFDKGISGFGLSASFLTTEDINGYCLSTGYSVNSILDLGLAIGIYTAELEAFNSSLNSTAISPHLGINLIKQDYNIPISLYVSGAYKNEKFSGDILDDYNLEMKGSAFSFGGLLYSTILTSPNFSIIPNAGINYTSAKVKIVDNYGNSISEDDNSTAFSFGLGLGIKLESNQVFFIDPSVSINANNTTFRMSIGIAFLTTKINSYDKSSTNNIQEQDGLDFLFNDRGIKYLNIKNVIKKYLLVYLDESTPMNIGDAYKIVRCNDINNKESGYKEIGAAKVLKIKGNKVALKFELYSSNNILTTQDKIEYK